MKKRICALLLCAGMRFGVLMTGCGSPSNSNDAPVAPSESLSGDAPAASAGLDLPDIKLNYSSCFPDTHNFSILDKEWLEELKTQANIEFTPYWNNALVSATAPYTETLSGVSDMTHIPAGAESDHFLIDNAVQLFYYGETDQQVLFDTARELFAQTPEWQAEFEGVRVNTWGASGMLSLHTTKPVTSLEDIKGMSIRCTEDSAFKLIQALGGNPVRMPISELFEALSKGIVEGVVLPLEALQSTKVADLVSYSVPLNISGAYCPHSYISDASYAKLTADQQQIFDTLSLERSQKQVDSLAEWDQVGVDYATEKGVTFNTLSDEDYAQITECMKQIAIDAIQELNAAGYDGQTIHDRARTILSEQAANK